MRLIGGSSVHPLRISSDGVDGGSGASLQIFAVEKLKEILVAATFNGTNAKELAGLLLHVSGILPNPLLEGLTEERVKGQKTALEDCQEKAQACFEQLSKLFAELLVCDSISGVENYVDENKSGSGSTKKLNNKAKTDLVGKFRAEEDMAKVCRILKVARESINQMRGAWDGALTVITDQDVSAATRPGGISLVNQVIRKLTNVHHHPQPLLLQRFSPESIILALVDLVNGSASDTRREQPDSVKTIENVSRSAVVQQSSSLKAIYGTAQLYEKLEEICNNVTAAISQLDRAVGLPPEDDQDTNAMRAYSAEIDGKIAELCAIHGEFDHLQLSARGEHTRYELEMDGLLHATKFLPQIWPRLREHPNFLKEAGDYTNLGLDMLVVLFFCCHRYTLDLIPSEDPDRKSLDNILQPRYNEIHQGNNGYLSFIRKGLEKMGFSQLDANQESLGKLLTSLQYPNEVYREANALLTEIQKRKF